MNKIEKPEDASVSKVDEAYALIEEQIITLSLAPGQLLSENELAQKYNLGRTPVREALQRLAQHHLVEIMPRRGVRVSAIDVKTQIRLIEVRNVLEQLQAKLAAQRSNEKQKKRFQDIAKAMEKSAQKNDYLSFVRLDKEFNALMADTCDNLFVAPMLGQLHGLSRRFWHCHFQKKNDLLEVSRLHAQVAKAIAAGNELKAEQAAKEHMAYIFAFTKATLES